MMTERHDPEVYNTTNRRLQKTGEGSGASSRAALETKTKEKFSRTAPGMEMGLEKGIGMGTMEHEECRGRADNSPAAAPLQPRLRTPAPPGLPMEGQRTAGKGPEGDGTHFLKPEGPEEGAHPPHPYEAPTTIRTQEEEERFPDGLPFGKEEPAGEPQKGSQPQDTEWKLQVY